MDAIRSRSETPSDGILRFTMLAVAVTCITAGCQKQQLTSAKTEKPTGPVARTVRVLLADRHPACRVRIDGPFTIRDERGQTIYRAGGCGWTDITSYGDKVRFGNGVSASRIEIDPDGSTPIELRHPKSRGWSEARRYPGWLRVAPNGSSSIQVVNHVDIDRYVACVLPAELFPHFEIEAFRAQSIAARTYALYQMADRAGHPYDVSATEMSQVYPGLREGDVARRAMAATQYTRGIVTTWSSPKGERIFCTFYSACCGGRTQNVANCRTDVAPIEPLRGGVPCGCPRVATSYRWDATRISKRELTRKLTTRYSDLKRLGQIDGIRVAETTPWGRPKVFELVGRRGQTARIVAENFRLAVGSRTIRSTNVRIRDGGDYFEFLDGKGFGHGMGLCQWGMQEMALRGVEAGAILKHYYPGCHLTRAY